MWHLLSRWCHIWYWTLKRCLPITFIRHEFLYISASKMWHDYILKKNAIYRKEWTRYDKNHDQNKTDHLCQRALHKKGNYNKDLHRVTFKAATITQNSDELASTSLLPSLIIICNSEPRIPEKRVSKIHFHRRKNRSHEANSRNQTVR